jgi:hypothetical protein
MTPNTPTPAATAPAGQAHTPTPWARTGLVVHREHSHAVAVIADCYYVGGTYDMNMANAAHIVHCVNAHSQLLAQNAELLAFLQHWIYDGSLQTFEDRERFRDAARALIAKCSP